MELFESAGKLKSTIIAQLIRKGNDFTRKYLPKITRNVSIEDVTDTMLGVSTSDYSFDIVKLIKEAYTDLSKKNKVNPEMCEYIVVCNDNIIAFLNTAHGKHGFIIGVDSQKIPSSYQTTNSTNDIDTVLTDNDNVKVIAYSIVSL